MGLVTKIEWCDHTFNPWWGCKKVSSGCVNCYAEAFSNRLGKDFSAHHFFGEKHWAEPIKWNAGAARAGVRKRVFCASMADVFEDSPDLEEARARLFEMVQRTPWLDWLLLTKRPEWMRYYFETNLIPDNVWLGATVENQEMAERRIPILTSIHPRVRFLSCEPLLGELHLAHLLEGIDWVIAGGESGPGARKMEEAWVTELQEDCYLRGVPFFFKQWGEFDCRGERVGKKVAGRLLVGREWNEFPGDGEYSRRGAEAQRL